LAYSIFTPGLIDELREELTPALKTSEIDSSHILDKSPKFSAVWQETLRMAASAASVRIVSEDTEINGYKLRKGGRVIVPFRKLHLDPGVFGSDSNEFKADRFAKDPLLHRHIRAFGGGATFCPGRHLSKVWIGCIVAMLLDRFDLVLEGNQQFPQSSEVNPSLGMLGVKGDDLMVRLKPRKNLASA
jgi:cytochrome P450